MGWRVLWWANFEAKRRAVPEVLESERFIRWKITLIRRKIRWPKINESQGEKRRKNREKFRAEKNFWIERQFFGAKYTFKDAIFSAWVSKFEKYDGDKKTSFEDKISFGSKNEEERNSEVIGVYNNF